MLTGKTIGSIVAALVTVGLLQVVPSYSQAADNGVLVDIAEGETVAADPFAENSEDHEDPEDCIWESSDVIQIVFDGNTIATNGAGATVDGSKVTITRGGTYSLSGILADGQIIVHSGDKETVRLVLDGVYIRSSSSAPILIEDAKKTIIILAENSENYLADGRSNTVEDSQVDEPNSVIFSKDDLTICGTGLLAVCGDVNDGISSKDGLIIAGGTIDVNAVDDGIRGKDYLVVRGGNIIVNAGGDGLKSDNDEDATMGYISIETGMVSITSGADAIQAETDVLVAGGEITLSSGGGSRNRNSVSTSAKGIKAAVSVIIDGGNLTVDSFDDAIHTDGSLIVNRGTFALSSKDDAIHSDSTVEVNGGSIHAARCYEGIDANAITINDGDIQIISSDDGIVAGERVSLVYGVIGITAGGDAISAQTDVTISDGQITLSSGGGSSAGIDVDTSAKGIKGVGSVVIDGGDFTIDSADDAIHSNGSVTINGGTFVIYSGDDGIHADADVVVNGGDIRIAKSYEGMESADADITINDGSIHIVSSDDGINVAGGGDAMGMGGPGGGLPGGGLPGGGPPAGGGFTPPTVSGSYYLYINGGYLVIDAMGDGVDSNGSIAMTEGVVIVNGPTSNMNGALDHSSFQMTGGFLLAAGSSGMAQTTSTTSTQYSILVTFNTTLPAGTLVHIQDGAGQDVLTFMPTKPYSSVAFSSERLLLGSTYDVYYGGSSTGVALDGLYQDGTYTPGTKFASFTISGMVTNVGSGAGTRVRP